jgi:hypothetical protein
MKREQESRAWNGSLITTLCKQVGGARDRRPHGFGDLQTRSGDLVILISSGAKCTEDLQQETWEGCIGGGNTWGESKWAGAVQSSSLSTESHMLAGMTWSLRGGCRFCNYLCAHPLGSQTPLFLSLLKCFIVEHNELLETNIRGPYLTQTHTSTDCSQQICHLLFWLQAERG